jgi:hypothetical protein
MLAASMNNTGTAAAMPSQVGPAAYDDFYTIYAVAGQPIFQVLSVLDNGLPSDMPKRINDITTYGGNYGMITMDDTYLLYHTSAPDSYDGQVHSSKYR